MKLSGVIVVSMTLVASTALGQPSNSPARAFVVNDPSLGILLVANGGDPWVQCRDPDSAGQAQDRRASCRTLGYGLITGNPWPDRVVLCRDCYNQEDLGAAEIGVDPDARQAAPTPDTSKNNESIIGVINQQGVPVWAARRERWDEAGYASSDVSLMDPNKDGRTELLIEDEIGGGLGYGRDFSILSWDGTAMKVIFSVALRELIADTEQMWDGSTRDEESTVEFVMKSGEAFGIRVKTFVGRDGKVNKKKSIVREFSWNPSNAIYEETKAKKP